MAEQERRQRAAVMARVRELAEARTPKQRDADKRLFLAGLENEVARAEFARLGWGAAFCADEMRRFWEEMVPGAFE